MADRLGELAAVGYEAFAADCGGVDPANGCRMATFSQLPARVQGGWKAGVKAVLAEVYHQQEMARAAEVVAATVDGVIAANQPAEKPAEASVAVPVLEPAVEAPASKPAHKPAGHTAASKPRK